MQKVLFPVAYKADFINRRVRAYLLPYKFVDINNDKVLPGKVELIVGGHGYHADVTIAQSKKIDTIPGEVMRLTGFGSSESAIDYLKKLEPEWDESKSVTIVHLMRSRKK